MSHTKAVKQVIFPSRDGLQAPGHSEAQTEHGMIESDFGADGYKFKRCQVVLLEMCTLEIFPGLTGLFKTFTSTQTLHSQQESKSGKYLGPRDAFMHAMI